MTKHGHIPEEWIVSYAAGQLTDAKAMLVATHLTYHKDLQRSLKTAEMVGGAVLDNAEESSLSSGALDSVMAKIDALPERQPEAGKDITAAPTSEFDTPDPLAGYLKKNLDDVKWRLMGPGMYQAKLWKEENGENLWLLRARGGTEIPIHDHRGSEYTLILKGSYSVDGKRYMPGDMEIADCDVKDHQPVIDEGEDCICLVVTDAPIRLHSFVGRMVQPFIGL